MPRERTFAARLTPRCRVTHCGRELRRGRHSRGCCLSCYNGVRKLVLDGIYTWEQLEAAGIIGKVDSVKTWIEDELSRLEKLQTA